jgi:hypothetical protein
MKTKVLPSLAGALFLFSACDKATDAGAPKVKKDRAVKIKMIRFT